MADTVERARVLAGRVEDPNAREVLLFMLDAVGPEPDGTAADRRDGEAPQLGGDGNNNDTGGG